MSLYVFIDEFYNWGWSVRLTVYYRFSAFIFGRPAKDEVTLKLGYVVEQLTRVQERLVPYTEGEVEVTNTGGVEKSYEPIELLGS